MRATALRPQWFIIWHEMGHNFADSPAFYQFTAADPSHRAPYLEGIGSLAALWSFEIVGSCSSRLSAFALSDIAEEWANQKETRFANQLLDYQAAGAVYSTLTADVVDGILFELYDTFGAKIWFDIFSTFLPNDQGLPITLSGEAEQATWFVAAASASAGEDLRGLFHDAYGFPIDNDLWATLLGYGQQRVSARDFWSIDIDGDGYAASTGECDDCNPFIHPGAPEINDGVDNQCSGDAGFGPIDEIVATASFEGKDRFVWEAQSGATSYRVARSASAAFSGACVGVIMAQPSWIDSALPASNASFFYLVRAEAPHAGSWGRNSAGAERVVPAGCSVAP